jgi:hypothetical protein
LNEPVADEEFRRYLDALLRVIDRFPPGTPLG